MERIIFHVDVNNAFLSWSAIDMLKSGSKLDIRTIPSVVAGNEKERRGVVVAKSYPAKKAGIESGEPLFQARKKVDKLYVVKTDKTNYYKYSNAFYKILCKYSPSVERYSIDECFMDMTGMNKMYGNMIKLAYKIKDEIYKSLGFTVNIGIANSKLCAKMASDFEKPNKVHTLFMNEVKEKMWPLPVDDLFMVGKSSSKKLHELGINTIKDLANTNINILTRYFKSMGKIMYEYANGIDESPVEKPLPKNQGIGNSTTLSKDAEDLVTLNKVLRKLSDMVGIRLRSEEKYATVISIQLKNSNFFNYQKQKKLMNPISSNEDIYINACDLLKSAWNGDPIRLVGLRVSNFTNKTFEQISLFEKPGKIEQRSKVQNAMDEINKKYGNNTIISASLLNQKKENDH